MSRIQSCFQQLQQQQRKALIPYITAGDPNLEITKQLLPILATKRSKSPSASMSTHERDEV